VGALENTLSWPWFVRLLGWSITHERANKMIVLDKSKGIVNILDWSNLSAWVQDSKGSPRLGVIRKWARRTGQSRSKSLRSSSVVTRRFSGKRVTGSERPSGSDTAYFWLHYFLIPSLPVRCLCYTSIKTSRLPVLLQRKSEPKLCFRIAWAPCV
jgi:hypothetical protein